MPQVGKVRSLQLLSALLAVLALADSSDAVQIDLAADGIQLNEGCAGDAAAACGLRMYQVMVESFVDGDPNRNYNAGYGTSHHKGDIRGIINSLDYIQSQGLNAVWLTPVFDSAAGQAYQGGGTNLKLDATGYYARNYFEIDPKFGTLADAQELVDTAHSKGMYVFFDGVFGHHKGNLVASPTGKLPVDSSPGVVNYNAAASVEFYKEVATYWIDKLGIDGWRLDQAYQVPPVAWRQIKSAVDATSAARAQAGEQWGTLGYMVAEVWSGADYISEAAFGTDANPILDSAFDFPVRYATVGVLAGEESGLSGRPASTLADGWSYGAHDQTYPDHALPNLMLGNHDLVRYGDLLQRADIASPADAEYWTRHRLAFMVQGAYSGPITRYYGEEIGDEVPNYADQVTNNCANLGLCDDHVARTSAKILDVTITSAQLSTNQLGLLDFHRQLMDVRSAYPALSHGTRQHLYSDDNLYIDLKTYGGEQIVFAMNISDQPTVVEISETLFATLPAHAWDLLNSEQIDFAGDYLTFTLAPLSGRYILLAEGPSVLPGDYNGNGAVDAADYTVWRDYLGTNFDLHGNGNEQGDSVGIVDEADYGTWKSNFGAAGSASSSGSVPEPNALMLFTLAGFGLVAVRRR
jgi:glycosidase